MLKLLDFMDKSGDDYASTNKVNMNWLQSFYPGLNVTSRLLSKFLYALAPIKCYQS